MLLSILILLQFSEPATSCDSAQMASYFFSCRSHCHSLSHSLPCLLLLLLFNSNSNSILSIYLSLLQIEELRLRLLSLSLGVLSRTRALLCMLSLIFVCLRLQPVTAFGTLPQPSALCSAVHALSHWRSFRLPASSRQAHSHTAFGLPSTLFAFALSLSAAACAECAIDLGDIVAGVVDIVSRLRTFNANARGICSRSTRLASFASFAAAAASASAE